jgi:hypothetical protein
MIVTQRATLTLGPNGARREPNSAPVAGNPAKNSGIPVKSKGSRGVPPQAGAEVLSNMNASRAYVSDRGHHARWSES